MISEENRAFFAREDELNMDAYVVFNYYLESTHDPEEAAAHLCREQSTALVGPTLQQTDGIRLNRFY